MSKYIISGGPGAGKTTVLNALKENGFRISEEVPRRLIEEFSVTNSECLPWKNRALFTECVIKEMVEEHKKADAQHLPTFFDRGLPDIIGYNTLYNFPVDEKLLNTIKQYPYEQTMFMTPPWPDIYVKDSARREDFEESVSIHKALDMAYRSLGFNVVELPFTSVDDRVAFIQNFIGFGRKDLKQSYRPS